MGRGVLSLLLAVAPLLSARADTSGDFEAGRRGHVLVPVSVNGQEARPFAVDTAASVTVLDAGEFAALGGDGPQPAVGTSHAQGAHSSFAARVITVDSLALWQVERRDQQVALMPLSELTPGRVPDFAGVLGLPLLRNYRIDLDYPERRLSLYQLDGELPPCEVCVPERAVQITPLVGGLPSVPVTIDGVRMTALLDTGGLAVVCAAHGA